MRGGHKVVLVGLVASLTGTGIAVGCSADGGGGQIGNGGEGGAGGSGEGLGGSFTLTGGGDAGPDVTENPCFGQCGDTELCDEAHLGLDDNCDGKVDEGCACVPGQAHACFKGDPSYHNAPGCFDGSEKCTEFGTWGPCIGGVHATPDDKCYENDQSKCHGITSVPFADVHLKPGTGDFGMNADPDSEKWEVECPTGVDPCPGVGGTNPPDLYNPLQSGEYQVTYKKKVGGESASCTYPLFVGAPGLRVELSWEHPDPPGESGGVDLDLHVHRPDNKQPWAVSGASQDCGYGNCTFSAFSPPDGDSPHWFVNGAAPPDPVNWFKDPVEEKNTCYYAVRGVGKKWKKYGLGCHNPRLDADNVDCDSGETDPNGEEFCSPENINIDFPPKKQWTRVGVYYFGSGGKTYSVHPTVKIFCNGALAAELGPAGFYDPPAPVTFTAADGADPSNGNIFWVAADVVFPDESCSTTQCIVQPIYSDKATKTPMLITGKIAETKFIPEYPPLP